MTTKISTIIPHHHIIPVNKGTMMMITMVIRLILARLKRPEVIKTFEDQPLGTDINLTTDK